ncbi:MAG: hypothetical protein EAZ47_10965 [Bacteroidetes bacterium]|nr:MAG: hypothetical protein EAY72_05370 [Bacteroidota bacterium]TAF90609.1 MAG: hypothetical protein EAZ47_10965 [Bacteroidota bacterium]
MKSIFTSVIVSFTLLSSCVNSQDVIYSKGSSEFNSFPSSYNVTTSVLAQLGDAYVRDILLVDSKLVLVNLKESNAQVLSVLNLNTKVVTELGYKRGFGSNEVAVPIQSGLLPNGNIYLFDPTQKKLVKGIINAENKWKPLSSQRIKDGHYSFRMINDSTAYGFGSSHTLGKIQYLNVNTGIEKDLFGEFLKVPKGFKPGSWKHAHEGFLFLKPDRTMVVLAHRYFDKIELFNIQAKTSTSLSGPKNIALSATPFSTQGMDIIMTNESTVFAYTNGFVTDKFIFAVFSNKPEGKPGANIGKDVFVFSWDGKPIAHITLDLEVSALAVTKDNKTLYGFSPSKQAIVTAKVPF